MAGVQAHMKTWYMSNGAGRCSPSLLEDLALHNPSFVRPIHRGYDILRDSPLGFTHGQGTLGGVLHPHGCQHSFWLKPRQSAPPALDERPNAQTKWSLAAICWKCRIHLHLKLDYTNGWQPTSCPTADTPLHHFVRAEWREGTEKRSWEQAMLGSDSDIVVYQCSASTCSAILTVRYTPQQLNQDMIHTLTDPIQLSRRTEDAFKAFPHNAAQLKRPAVIDVLNDLRIYLKNPWNTDPQPRRIIQMTNNRFVVRFGPNGDACKDVLEFLRFRRDEVNQSWHVPQPKLDDTVPLSDPVNMFLDDVEQELLALMISRPREELATMPDLSPPLLASKDMQRLLSAQDYDTILFHRGRTNDPAARPKQFVGLGIVPDAADHLVRYAYKCQTASDPVNVPFYFEFLRDIALERRSEVLQTEVGFEESIGRFTASALEQAHTAFGIARQDSVDDENIIGMFQSRIMDAPAQESELRHNLRIIGSFRSSSKILAVADNVMDTHEQALQFLGADASVSDDSIPPLYTVKINENSTFEEQAKKAVRLIANHRNSRLLKRYIDAGFVGDLSMDAADGYTALNIHDRTIDTELIKSAYDSALFDFPDNREYYEKALLAIAADRNSAELRQHASGSAQNGWEVPGNSEEPVGLDNIGNTCYLNSLLQFLFTLVELRQIVLDFDRYKMDLTEDNLRDKKVGQRKITRREAQSAQYFVDNLGKLFQGMIQTPTSTITPDKELARLTLETYAAKENLRRRSTMKGDRPSLGNLDHQSLPPNLIDDQDTDAASGQVSGVAESTMMPDNDIQMSDIVETPTSENSSEATLISNPATPETPAMDLETVEQQEELLNNKENLSPTKLDISPKHGDIEMEHPEPLAPTSPSKENAQAGVFAKALAEKNGEVLPKAEPTITYAPPPGKPPPVPPRNPIESTTSILEQYARQQDVTEVLAHAIFQFSCAIRGAGTDVSGEQRDEVHDMFYGQSISHTVPEKETPTPVPFNSIITRVVNKPKDVYDALDNEYDLSEREDGSKAFVSMATLPPIFSVLLDRVSWDKTAQRAIKLDDHVQISETIFLDRYLEAAPESELMQRRKQAWVMKTELATLTRRRDRLAEKIANSQDIPTLFADAKLALEHLQSSPDFAGPDSPFGEFAADLGPLAGKLGALADDLAAESKAVEARIAHLEQQLKESFADMRKHPYRLHAAFFHRGGASSGHYWIYIYDHKKECWRKYNDEHVNVVDNRNEIFSRPEGAYGIANPYFLVYVREDQLDKLVQSVKREINYPRTENMPVSFDPDWKNDWQQPQSQVEALPPRGFSGDQEMVQVKKEHGSWAAGESSAHQGHSGSGWEEPQGVDNPGTWHDSELTSSRKVDWSR